MTIFFEVLRGVLIFKIVPTRSLFYFFSLLQVGSHIDGSKEIALAIAGIEPATLLSRGYQADHSATTLNA